MICWVFAVLWGLDRSKEYLRTMPSRGSLRVPVVLTILR
ncbi:hypothetical protein SLEP1_g11984 [Rubroshorea leprosula]|nr:hypothetical protein SLEP1_g11984 [Rubroshorea leprosula]